MQKPTLFSSIILLLATISILSCDNDQPKPSGCCNNPPIAEEVGIGHVYVPNIFTPDFDGLNDLITVFSDSEIKLIRTMTITDKNNVIVFWASDFLPNDPIQGWNGRVNGKVIKGIYQITVEAEDIEGTIKTLYGQVCSFPCDEDAMLNEPLKTDKCRFPSQHNGDGNFDLTLATGEPGDCFE